MPPDPNGAEEPPPQGVARALEIAIAHEQVLLSSIAGFDGKLMLLTVLNVAGISALVGIAASADPIAWLFGLSMASCALCALAGLGNLWAGGVDQFPTPDEAIRTAEENALDEETLTWLYLQAVRQVARRAETTINRKTWLMRALLIGTPVSLGLVVAAALTVVS